MRSYKEDKSIKRVLNYEVENMEVSPDLFNRIRKNIYEEEQKKTMKNRSFILTRKKGIALVASLCLIVGSAIAAGTSGSWVSHSYRKYTAFPEKEQVQKDNGFTPKYVESLPGGFEFVSGHIGEGSMEDETGKEVTKTKEVSFAYSNDEKSKMPVSLNAILVAEEYLTEEGTKLDESYKGLDLYYYNQTYKFVPSDYTLTEEDNKAMITGELEVSYGSSEVEIQQIQAISWYEDGISYNIMGSDYGFEVEDLVEMAETVIDVE